MLQYALMFKRTLIGLFLAALSVSGFASTFIFGALLTKDCGVSPEVLSFLRFTIAGSTMLVICSISSKGRNRMFAPRRHDWFAFVWQGVVGTSLMAWCVFMGCARVSAANASMADALTPLMIFAVAAVKSRHVERRELIGLACGFIGALLVIQVVHRGGIALAAYSLGDVFILMAAATWDVYTVYGRPYIERLGSAVYTTWTMLIGAAAIGLFLPFGSFVWPTDLRAGLLTAALGLVSTLLPFWTWNAAQKYLPMSVLGITAYFTPVVAVALALLFLNERATALQWLGTLFVIASAVVETRSRSTETPDHSPWRRGGAQRIHSAEKSPQAESGANKSSHGFVSQAAPGMSNSPKSGCAEE